MFLFLPLVFLILLSSTASLKLEWYPEDDNSLPLSTNYRNTLRKLCLMMKNGQKLPPDTNIEKLTKMCKKLAEDDRRSTSYTGGGIISFKGLIKFVLVAGSLYFVVNNFHIIKLGAKKWISMLKQVPIPKIAADSPELAQHQLDMAREIREARLKRFANSATKDD